MDTNTRIAQWEKMAQDDPDNSMGWFSLGNAYKDADRFEDAAGALRKAIEIDPSLSRAYQVLAQVLLKLERHEEAAEKLTEGYRVAAERGDVMPQRAMGSLMNKLGIPVPEVQSKVEERPEDLDAEQVLDRRSGQPGPRLPDPPMRGPLGKFIYDHYSAPTFREWIGMGTKVINELRLDLSNPQHQDIYEQHMLEWLGFTREEAEQYAAEQAQQQQAEAQSDQSQA
jgi:tetratricopeptide (TPR) repeat protein